MTQAVVIKSKPYGIQLFLNPEMDFEDLVLAVIAKFEEAEGFFRDAKVGISFEGFALTSEQEYRLINEITEHTSIKIVCIMEGGEIREACVLADVEQMVKNKIIGSAIIWPQKLKPSDHVHSKVGLVIMGDVPEGARVTAAGSIFVYGRLKGAAHAGKQGDAAAVIAALSIETKELQIGEHLFVPKEKKKEAPKGFWRKRKQDKKKDERHSEDMTETLLPQYAHLRNGQVVLSSPDKL